MVPRDAMIDEDEVRRFAGDVVERIARHGNLSLTEAEEVYNRSIIPAGLEEAPDYYLHESPFYWAMYLLTGSREVGQEPPALSQDGTELLHPGIVMIWPEVQKRLRISALPARSINWKGQAACPEVAWIITWLDGPGNRLERPDRLAGGFFLLSAEEISPAATRMLNSKCRFLLHVFRRIPGKPVRYEFLGFGTVIGFDNDPSYPHWKIKLRPANPVDRRQFG